MDTERVRAWVAGYERAWRAAGTDGLAELFTEDISYLQGPYRDPVVGLPAVARMWEAERDGPDEPFDMESEIEAVDGDTAVVRVQVNYRAPAQEYRDLWIVRFAADGRCRAFEEWPFWPDRPTTSGRSGGQPEPGPAPGP
jgi:ketosteroid isomerase-like protein